MRIIVVLSLLLMAGANESSENKQQEVGSETSFVFTNDDRRPAPCRIGIFYRFTPN